LLVFGWTAHVTWYAHVLAPYSEGQVLAFNVQSTRAFLGRLAFEPDVLTDWRLQQLPAYVRHASTAAILVLIGATVAAFMRRTECSRDHDMLTREFPMILVLTCLTAPLTWSHYYCWLLIPIAVLIASRRMERDWFDKTLLFLCVALLLPPIMIVGEPMQGTWLYAKVLVSGLYVAGLLAAFLLLRTRRAIKG
jgi:hypothetical protein